MGLIPESLIDRLRFKQSSLGSGGLGVLLILGFFLLSLWTLFSTRDTYFLSFQEEDILMQRVAEFSSQLDPEENLSSYEGWEEYMDDERNLKRVIEERSKDLNNGLSLYVFYTCIVFALSYNRWFLKKFLKNYRDPGPGFTEIEPHEKGFSAYFEKKIRPTLDKLEIFRLQQYRSYKMRLLVAVPAAAALIVGGISLDVILEIEVILFSEIGIVAGFVFLYWSYDPVLKYKGEIKKNLCLRFANFMETLRMNCSNVHVH